MWMRRLFHLTTALLVLAAVAVGYRRFHRTPEQIELQQYIEFDVPRLSETEAPIRSGIAALLRAPGLPIADARRLLVDQLMPRLLLLRKTADVAFAQTNEVRLLKQEYVAIIDRLIETCRRCIRFIDDPKPNGAAQFLQFQKELRDITQAFTDWSLHVKSACHRHHLD